jgi:hypothetical protein
MIVNKKWLSDQILSVGDNIYMKAHFYNLLYLICVNRFRWTNLPKGVDPDWIEKALINEGEIAFINHKIYGYVFCHCCGDDINMYGRPTRYLCWTDNNIICDYFQADSNEIVIIRNNKLSEPTHDFINRYASNISQIQKAKEVNLNAQKTPILISCSENDLLTLKNVYADYEGNEPVIYVNKTLDTDSLKVFKTDAPYVADKLQASKTDEMNECLTFLGINTTKDKKERMITDEVNANNDMVNICLSIFLNTRQQAREEIKQKMGLDIGLELAEYCKEEFEPKKEVNENE